MMWSKASPEVKARFSGGGHRLNDSVSYYACMEFRGEFHEDAAIGYRLYDGNGFCLSSARSSVLPEWHAATWSLRLH